ncbi:MAG TPA: uracil-DNA glycosylase, partial [Polyangia bacterium]|nr:uracil-DNA glycosylase [Polyangia bacterium]
MKDAPASARPKRRSLPVRAPEGPPSTLFSVRDAIVACEACPRLRTYCERIAREKKAAHRTEMYWGRPVPGFGDPAARLLVVGLAPAAHGANRTGRVFTGDGSGDFLMRALHDNGFANIPTARYAGDGLALKDAYILSVVRCAPPDNKPTPDEIARCRVHLHAELAMLPRVQVVVALGKIGWDGYLAYRRELGWAPVNGARPVFGHGARASLDRAPFALLGSYHPSRQNT